MNEALKEFFFETAIRSGETMKAFITRFITVERKLREQGVELPSEVKGWFMLRKLHLDHNRPGGYDFDSDSWFFQGGGGVTSCEGHSGQLQRKQQARAEGHLCGRRGHERADIKLMG